MIFQYEWVLHENSFICLETMEGPESQLGGAGSNPDYGDNGVH